MKRYLVPLIALLVFAGGLGAYASIPSVDGTIHGCFKKSTGTLRVINADTGRKCRSGEKAISWNEEGNRGPRGLKGATGPKGDRGPRGRRGLEGPAGATGPQGLTGESTPWISQHLTESILVTTVAPANPVSYSVPFTVPEGTLANAYYRVRVTTPPSCEGQAEASWTFQMQQRVNGNIHDSFNITMYPGTTLLPASGGSYPADRLLLPGEYELESWIVRAEFVPECADSLVETELYVMTEAAAVT